MSTVARKYAAAFLIPLVALLIFLVDLAAPLGIAVWLAYLALILVVAWTGRSDLVLALAAVCTVLMVLGFFLSPPGIAPWIAAVNRFGGVLVLWGAAFLMIYRRRLLAQVAAQSEALRDANLLLQDQAEEVEIQAEELQTQNEELWSLTETLEQRVVERTAALQKSNEALQHMSVRLTAVQENERQRISRELHDETGQLLTALTVGLGLLEQSCKQGEIELERITDLKQMANHLAEGVHRIAMDLRPATLDRAGLPAAVRQYVESCRRSYGLEIDLSDEGFGDGRLPPEVETALYRIVQEALTNVARHARATRAGVLLRRRADALVAIVEDDGVGFDVKAKINDGRLGLTGMQERAELLSGTLTVESQPGAGTTILVTIPYPAHAIPEGTEAFSEEAE